MSSKFKVSSRKLTYSILLSGSSPYYTKTFVGIATKDGDSDWRFISGSGQSFSSDDLVELTEIVRKLEREET